MRVFIVFGQTGEYSDHSTWPVRGFLDKARAEAFEFDLTKAAKAFHDENQARRKAFRHECRDNAASELSGPGADRFYKELAAWRAPVEAELKKRDPDFSYDYTGTDYYTVEVEVEP